VVRSASNERPGETSPADLNAPVFPGDTLLTSPSERAEVQLGGGGAFALTVEVPSPSFPSQTPMLK